MKRLKNLLRFSDVSGLFIHIALLSLLSLLSFEYPLFIILTIFYTLYIFKKNKVLGVYAVIIVVILIISLLINYFLFISFNPKSIVKGVVTYKENNYILIKDGIHYTRGYMDNTDEIEIGSIIRINHIPFEINERSIENTFSLYKYIMYKRIYLYTQVTDYEIIKKSFSIYTLKGYLINHIDRTYSNVSSSYVKELLLGISSLDDNVISSASNLGIIHLFVISGLHINIIKKGIDKFLSLFNIPEEINLVIIDLILIIYLFISSFSIAIIRVVLISVIESIFEIRGKRYYKIDILSITLIISLIINPFSIFELGFYLTYISTLVIMLSKDKNSVLVTLSVLSFSIPFLFYFNNSISLLIIPFTLVFGVIFTYLLIPFTYLILFIPLLDSIYSFMVDGLSNLLLFLNNINVTFSYSVNSPYILFVIILCVFLIYAFKDIKNKTITGVVLSLLLLFNILYIRYEITPSVKIMDVGQGDSILIRDGFKTILIDTGEKDNYNTIINYLKGENIARISALFISHKDSDHYALYGDILNNFYVDEVHIYENNTTYRYGRIHISTYSFENAKTENDKSMVLYVNIYNKSFLFTGDIEKEGEEYLYTKNIHNVDYLKVAHHGSNTSSMPKLIDKFNPRVSLISCGKNNKYGHPSKETIDTLNRSNSIIYRTDVMGSINIKVLKSFSIIDTYKKDEVFWFLRHKYLRFMT